MFRPKLQHIHDFSVARVDASLVPKKINPGTEVQHVAPLRTNPPDIKYHKEVAILAKCPNLNVPLFHGV